MLRRLIITIPRHAFFRYSLILSLLLIHFAYSAEIRGIVTDCETGSPVENANLTIDNSHLGAATDADGKFRITDVPDGKHTLSSSHLAYHKQTREIEISGSEPSSLIHFSLIPATLQMQEVVLTATRTEKKLADVPVPTELISRRQIESTGSNSAQDVLEWSLPGVDILPRSMGSDIRLHGLSNKYVLFLVDGERIAGETNGNIDYSRLDLNDVERIEVVKGASSTLYGSNAMSGVINLITRKPQPGISVEANSRVSRFDERSHGGSLGYNRDKLRLKTVVTYKTSDGYDLTPETQTEKTMEAFEDVNIKQSADYDLTDSFSLGLNAAYYTQEQENSTSVPTHPKLEGYSLNSAIRQKLTETNTLEYGWRLDNYEKFDVLEQLDDQERQTYKHRLNIGNFTQNFRIHTKHLLTYGAEYTNESMFSTRIDGENQQAEDWTGFLQDDINWKKNLSLVAGLRLNYHSEYGLHPTPKLSLMYKVNDFTLRGGYGAGFRSPTLKELYMDFEHFGLFKVLGNPDLEPETSHFLSGSVEWVRPKLNASLAFYHNRLRNMIQELESVEEPGVVNYLNIGQVWISGFDLTMRHRLGRGFTLSGGYSFVDTEDRDSGLELSGTVKQSGRIKLDYIYIRKEYQLNASIQGKLTGTKYYEYLNDDIEGVESENLAPYAIWKVVVTQRLNGNADLTLGVDNVFDYSDTVNFSTLDPGRRFFAAVSLHHSFTK